MPSLKDYLANTERRFAYRIKTVSELSDEAFVLVDRVMAKYNPLEIGTIQRTILQKNPIDFPNMNAEVLLFDIVLGMPASTSVLHHELVSALGLPEKFLVVRAPNDPNEIEAQRLEALGEIDAEAAEQGLARAALLPDETYAEADHKADDLYGSAYNVRFTDYLKRIADEKREAIAKVASAASPLFAWMPKPKTETGPEFDPAVAPAPEGKHSRGRMGNLDDNTREVASTFTDTNGKLKVLVKTVSATKDGK